MDAETFAGAKIEGTAAGLCTDALADADGTATAGVDDETFAGTDREGTTAGLCTDALADAEVSGTMGGATAVESV